MKPKKLPTKDLNVIYLGSVTILEPLTARARRWLRKSLAADGWQWQRGALVVESRCMLDIGPMLDASGLGV